MIIEKTRFALGVVTLTSLGVFVPATVVAQHGPGRHSRGSEGPTYDTKSEATFTGTVTDVRTGGRGRLGWLLSVHTMGLHKGVQEKQLLLRTDTETVHVHLGPTAFLKARKVEIEKGDTLEVIGSLVTIGESQVVLARDIRKGDNAWALRDATGQPLWGSVPTERRRFWTKKKVLLTVVVAKVLLLATVLRH
jgi:hypothetical protein